MADDTTQANGKDDDASYVSLVDQATPPKPAAPDPDEAVRAELRETKAAMARERARADHAEQQNRELQTVAGRSQNDARGHALASLDSAISARVAERQRIGALRTAALQAGDFDKEAELNTQLADLAAELVTLKQGKAQTEWEAKQQQQRQAAPQQQQQRLSGNPVEDFLARTGIRGASADWIRSHPEAAHQPNKLSLAHAAALEDGLKVESPEYFERVESLMGLRRGEPERNADPVSEAGESRVAPRRPTAAAPPSRPANGGQTPAGGIRLTPAQRRAAEISGVSEEKYAENLVRARKQTQSETLQ